jgi:hypothetical protein
LRVALDDGRETLTDLCGFYAFFEVAPGSHTATATAPDDATRTGSRTITAGGVAELDFNFGATEIESSGFCAY